MAKAPDKAPKKTKAKAEYSKQWPALRACADVEIRECGGLKLKRNQRIASTDAIYRALQNQYPELVGCESLQKEGSKPEDVVLAKKVYEIYEGPKEKKEKAEK